MSQEVLDNPQEFINVIEAAIEQAIIDLNSVADRDGKAIAVPGIRKMMLGVTEALNAIRAGYGIEPVDVPPVMFKPSECGHIFDLRKCSKCGVVVRYVPERGVLVPLEVEL